jgi:hypothetical protein
MIAEGKAIGGGTEINGGLFWKTPKFILDDWVLRGFSSLDLAQFDEDLNFYEKKLSVADAKVRKNYDLDSQKLVYGAQLLGLNVAIARRLAPSCAKNNLCPSGCPSGAKLTMSRTLIREGVCQGGKLISDAKVTKINCKKSYLEVIVKKDQAEKEKQFLGIHATHELDRVQSESGPHAGKLICKTCNNNKSPTN